MITTDPVNCDDLEPADAAGTIKLIPAIEHKDVALPPGMLRANGELDLADEVQSFVEVKYSKGNRAFTIRSNGWIGHIPLNRRYTLATETKVPIANLERILDRATFPPSSFKTLSERQRRYGDSADRPSSLLDVLADGFLAALEDVRTEGVLKSYLERTHVGTSPAGRFDPMRSLVKTRTNGRPMAVSGRFERSLDNIPNRVLRLATDTLARCYPLCAEKPARRISALASAMAWLPLLDRPHPNDLTSVGIERAIRILPDSHRAYSPALTLAGLIVSGRGLSLLDRRLSTTAPVALVNMDLIFEGYCRNILGAWSENEWRVLNGNSEGSGGAKLRLFTAHSIEEAQSPTAEPDIVIEKDGATRLIIDTKYRTASSVPSRDVINQLACYATRYDCQDVMALYPALPKGRQSTVELIGEIGPLRVHRGSIDVSRSDLTVVESDFCRAIQSLIEV